MRFVDEGLGLIRHRHKLAPTTEALWRDVRLRSDGLPAQSMSIYQAKQLAKETRYSLRVNILP